LDAPEVETAALAFGAAIHDLGWMRRVAVRGSDRFRWLSGMVTNTVNDLFPNTGAWNLVLNAQGRIQGDLTVWRGGEEASPQRRSPSSPAPMSGDPMLGTPFAGESELELEIAADQFEKLLAHLNKFIIMDDVELVPLGDEQ
jgi:folate-binding Fe-S cluster repair protein YgfZ